MFSDIVVFACFLPGEEFIWDDPHKFQIRLQDGSYPSEGRLEFYIFGSWHTLCDDSFGSDPAETACRQLGYTDLLNVDQLDL